MATHSSILAWKILWAEEPSGLEPIGSCRVIRLKQLSRQHPDSLKGHHPLDNYPEFCFTF